jgi:ribosome maturation factor RimP
MGLEGTDLWSTIEQVARDEGVQLFDVELPSDTRRGGALRVFITRAQPDGGISFEDCVRVSKHILDLDEQRELIPGNCTLEVSSPGINRKLRLPSHFCGAVGERIKVKFRNVDSGLTIVINGIVKQASGDAIEVESEVKQELFKIPFSEIKEARVDFKF